MSKSICCIHECGKPFYGKWLCQTHYGYLYRHGSTEKPLSASKICRMTRCHRRRQTDGFCDYHIRKFTTEKKPAPGCAISGCRRPFYGKCLCQLHLSRLRKTGSTELRKAVAEKCKMPSCESRSQTAGWCIKHYARIQRTGSPFERDPRAYETAQCGVCGDSFERTNPRQKHCSGACQAAHSMHRGQRPDSFTCVMCKRDIPLKGRARGRLLRTDTKWCLDCGRNSIEGRRFFKYGVTPEEYATMIAAGCNICGATDRKFHVDHDHECCPAAKNSCGKCVRGVLCGQCNQGLGLLGDSADNIRAAADYLDRWSISKALC